MQTITINFKQRDGLTVAVEAPVGSTVMEVARLANVRGIEAECGGACSCGTCHVYIEEPWREAVGAASQLEGEMLEFIENFRASSRLSCQIEVVAEFDGLVVVVPD